jgi:predicted phage tail protein
MPKGHHDPIDDYREMVDNRFNEGYWASGKGLASRIRQIGAASRKPRKQKIGFFLTMLGAALILASTAYARPLWIAGTGVCVILVGIGLLRLRP